MRIALTTLTALMLSLAALPALADSRVVPNSQGEMQLSFAPVVKRTSPAVVNVYSQRIVASQANRYYDDPFFRRFFGDDGSFGRPRERVQN